MQSYRHLSAGWKREEEGRGIAYFSILAAASCACYSLARRCCLRELFSTKQTNEETDFEKIISTASDGGE